jgi:hypothetical protein
MPRKMSHFRFIVVLVCFVVALSALMSRSRVSFAQDLGAQEVLQPTAGTLDGQLWFIANGGPSDAITGHVNSADTKPVHCLRSQLSSFVLRALTNT